jgi:TPR repeat protein
METTGPSRVQCFIRWSDGIETYGAWGVDQEDRVATRRRVKIIWDLRALSTPDEPDRFPHAFSTLDVIPTNGNPILRLDGQDIRNYLEGAHSDTTARHAYLLLAECKRSGLFGVKPNPKDVLYYLRKAAHLEDHRAHLILSQMYFKSDPDCGVDEKDMDAYRYHLKMAAGGGNDTANWIYYHAYSDINGNKDLEIEGPDAEQAKKHFWKAVEAGHPTALLKASKLHQGLEKKQFYLLGAKPDPEKAKEFFWQAIAANHPEALYQAYKLYQNKKGAPYLGIAQGDAEKSYEYFWGALKNESRDASYDLGQMHRKIGGDPRYGIISQDLNLYRKFHFLALEKKQRDALWDTYQAYHRGSAELEIEPDLEQAKKYFWKTVSVEHKEACWEAYRAYKNPEHYPGLGIDMPDKKKAAHFLRVAAESGHPKALWKMSLKYDSPDEDDGIFHRIYQPNPDKANKLRELAAKAGHPTAQIACIAKAFHENKIEDGYFWLNKLKYNDKVKNYMKYDKTVQNFTRNIDFEKDIQAQVIQLFPANVGYDLRRKKPA